MEPGPVVVLSPHLDDAVFSAWTVLTSPADVRVVTVFAGIPPEGFVSPLDESGGAAASAARVRERRVDDAEALAAAGRVPTHLDFLDVQYRVEAIPSLREEVARRPREFVAIVTGNEEARLAPEELAPVLDGIVEGAAVVYAPTGIGGHPDHCDVARYGAWLLERGAPVRFYCDIPYHVRHGFPSWLAGSGAENRDADEWVDGALRDLVGDPGRLERQMVRLAPDEMARKLDASRLYTTEFGPANDDFGGALEDPEVMGWEIFWVPRAR